MTLVVIVPGTPSAVLSPNAPRAIHWGTKTKVRRQLKHDAFYATYAAIGAMEPHDTACYATATVRITVAWEPGRKRQDADNLLASCKWLMDAIAECLNVDDKGFTYEPVAQERDPDGKGYVRVELTTEAA